MPVSDNSFSDVSIRLNPDGSRDESFVAANLGADALASAGFDASHGSSLVVAQDGHPLVLVGIGDPAELDADKLRDAAAAAGAVTAMKAAWAKKASRTWR